MLIGLSKIELCERKHDAGERKVSYLYILR